MTRLTVGAAGLLVGGDTADTMTMPGGLSFGTGGAHFRLSRHSLRSNPMVSYVFSAMVIVTAFVWSQTATAAEAGDFIQVSNPRTLPDRLPAERVPFGVRGDYKPCIARLPDGRLVIVAFHQQPLGDGKIREDIFLFRSADGGRTWSTPALLDGVLGREPYLTVLKDGTLLMTVHLLPQDVRNKDGYTHCYVHRSEDGGRTWATTRTQPDGLPAKTETVTTRNVLQLSDGSLMLGVSGNKAGLDYIWRSADGGRTWTEKYPAKVEGVRRDYPFPFFGEAVLWQAKSGRVYAVARVDSRYFPPLPNRNIRLGDSDHYDRMILYTSADTGRTWQVARDFGDYGEMYPAVLRLNDERLLLTFTVREVKRPLGLRAVLGREEPDGFQFDFGQDRLMLDAKTPDDRDSGGGFGRAVQLDNGTLVACYSYRGTDNEVHCEVVRWRLPAK